jgi:hypothetical protein
MSSENGKRLEAAILTSLTEGGAIPTEEEISSLASQLRNIRIYAVEDDEFANVIKRLHEALRIDMGLGCKVVDAYAPWLQSRKAEIEPFYWRRYQLSLKKQGWSPKVLNALDKVTDDILDLSGNPATNSGWPRRGLVMGDVQSGKTSNYTGLICKAADSGYRLIVLLTGTLESLRRQTQERLDSGFVGLDSSGVVSRNRSRREIGVGLIDARRAAGVFTSTLVDFRAGMVNQLGFRLDAFNEPVLLVVKKHKRILENLTEWLKNYNANASGTIDMPMLLVDDEADNASVNVNSDSEKATAINAAIRGLLNVFPRSTYVGFTATPFANVFIHPDSREEMLGDDLFPRDFVYALDSPTNYFGASTVFGEDSRVECTRPIEDADAYFPKGHKSSLQIDGLPSSLEDAIRTFLIANAIMDVRGQPHHRSMLVNVSHFTDVQIQVADHVEALVKQYQEEVRAFAGLGELEASKSRFIRDLKNAYETEYGECDVTWKQVLSALTAAILPIVVRSVNQKSGAASLAYAEHAQSGLRIIAVGGNSLSRGLTLEGLCVSYFHRGTQMYDTLLQMGRWFGYRPGYEDLVRLWITPEAEQWYAHIADATEELRREIRRMQLSRLKPIDFGMRVRAHPEALLITARNKMRHSSEITTVLSVSSEGLETARLLHDPDAIQANFRAARQLLSVVDTQVNRDPNNTNPLWRSVPKHVVVDFLRSFSGHPLNVTFQPQDLADFIEQSTDGKLARWDVVVPQGSGEPHELLPTLKVALQKRKLSISEEQRSILVNEQRMRVGSRGVEKEGMSPDQIASAEKNFWASLDSVGIKNVPDWAYRAERQRPLLLIHFLQGSVKDAPYPVPIDSALTALGLSFPALAEGSRRVKYRINLVEIRNMLSASEEGGDDLDDEEPKD